MTGAELRAARHRLGLTQTALGAALDLSRDRIARYETGKSPLPRVVALAVVALGLLLARAGHTDLAGELGMAGARQGAL